jgi:1-aminocyclopropane-1-carboxylate deaminase/D-cysteine desulfhydrase-like pyridoxal-dependent ACC family enzyme
VLNVRETEIELLARVSSRVGAEIWIKRDDRTHVVYGGNKPRKLSRILAHAKRAGADTLITAGAVGSHHALATAVHGRALGFEVHVVLAPQPYTEHAETVIRATIAQRAVVHPCPNGLLVPAYVAAVRTKLMARGRRVWTIPVGGSDVRGASAYWDAMLEVRSQIARGAMVGRWPDLIVCAHGSGGTHAGLLAAKIAHRIDTRVVGVMVAIPWAMPRARTAVLASRVAHANGVSVCVGPPDVELINDQLGTGYGARTSAGDEATELFSEDGIELDPTYTAKTAAAVIALARRGAVKRALYWHTLSSAPYEPLCAGFAGPLPTAIRALLR